MTSIPSAEAWRTTSLARIPVSTLTISLTPRRRGLLHHFAAHAVAVAQPMRNVESRLPARQFEALFQNHDRAGAVHVVIAIKQDALFLFDGAEQAVDRRVHSFKRHGS